MVLEKDIRVVDYRRLDRLIDSLARVGAIENSKYYRWPNQGEILIGPLLEKLLNKGR